MLLALHTGLLAALQAANQPQQQQQQQQGQQQPQQQQQEILVPSGALLCSLLRVLSVLVAVAPYDRLPSHLLPDVVDTTSGVWQRLQQLDSGADAPTAAAAGIAVSATAISSSSILAPEEVAAATAAAVAVLAQALSTKKPSAGLAAWLQHDKSAAAAAAAADVTTAAPQLSQLTAANGSLALSIRRLALPINSSSTSSGLPTGQTCSSSSSRVGSLVANLLAAAVSPRPLLRIEALAALRGCCINYPAALPDSVTANSSSSSSGSNWTAVLGAVQCSLAATQQVPRTPRGTPVANGSSSSTAASISSSSSKTNGSSNSSSEEVSASTSPEDKAAQHAVKLIGDWLAAAWKLAHLQDSSSSISATAAANGAAATHIDPDSTGSSSSSSNTSAVGAGQMFRQLPSLVQLWSEALELLLSDQLQQHPSYMIRSAAAAVTADIPAPIWQALPAALQQRVLESTAQAAQTDSVAAARAAACKVLGSLVLLPGMLEAPRQQQLQQLLLAPLGKCVRDATVSVRLSASWAVANACDALKAACGGSTVLQVGAGAAAQVIGDNAEAACGVAAVAAPALQLLCDASLAAAGDSEKVRANGIRAVGALLAGWRRDWGQTSSSSSTSSTSRDAASAADNILSTGAAAAAGSNSAASDASACAELAWLPVWLRAAVGQLQSCLASRSPKVVWNAAYAAAGLLQDSCLNARPEVGMFFFAVTVLFCVLQYVR
jgi:hypothetical protein